MRRHTLLIDADDTLWENNVFFEKLIEDFISIVEPYGYARAYIRHILNETERKNIRQYGYGVRSFGRSLEETYIKLADQMAKRETLALIHGRVIDLERTPPQILDGVPETLAYLTDRQQPAQRYQSGNEDRPQRRVHPAPAHLDTGTRTGGGGLRKTGHPACIPGPSRSFLDRA